MAQQRRLRAVVAYTVLLLWTLFVGLPLYWLIVRAFGQRQGNGGAALFPWIDFQRGLQAFHAVFVEQGDLYNLPFLNSTIVALSTALISTLIGSAAGYALARFRFRIGPWQNNQIAFAFLIQRMFPPAVLLIPFLLLYRTLNLLDSRSGLILAYCAFNIPFVVWIMRDFFRSLPVEVEESGLIDGCNRVGVLLRIAIPLALPGFATSFVLVMIASWNEFLFALTLLFIKVVTVPLVLSGAGYEGLAVLTLASLLPMVVLGLLFERSIVRGLMFGVVD
ncbi:MAG: carbohydrate ABC transporter permease [Chloroflexi bacterium]|nr:MAG: carbohydrate ABC transporter permease [Chloroflexota bacterium]